MKTVHFSGMSTTFNKKNILELPDDCLIMIFNQLNFPDLLQAQETCKRFQALSLYSFKAICHSIKIQCIDDSTFVVTASGKRENRQKMTYDAIKDFLKHFGMHITSLSVIGIDEVDITSILDLVKIHCPNNLESLNLQNVQIDIMQLENFKCLFEQLDEFGVIKALNPSTLEKCIKYSRNVRRLKIIGYHKDQLLLKIHSKLEEFFYDFVYIEMGHLRMFLQNYPNLKSIKVLRVFTLTTELLNYLKNIIKLSINMKCVCDNSQNNNLVGLFQLKQLKQLELISGKNITDLLLNITSSPVTKIEVLALKARQIRDACDLLRTFEFTNLTKLVICFYWNIDPCGDIGPAEISLIMKRLDSIKELHFINFTRDFFNKFVLQFVKYTQNLSILVLSPKTAIDLRVEDLCSLVDIQKTKNFRLTVEHEDVINDAVKIFSRKQNCISANLKFKNIDDCNYEFKYLND